MGRPTVIGIDINYFNIKAAIVTLVGERLRLVDVAQVESTEKLISDSRSLNYQVIVQKLKELKQTFPFLYRYFYNSAAMAIPDNTVINNQFEIKSSLTGKAQEFALLQAFSQSSPYTPQELAIDYLNDPYFLSKLNDCTKYTVYATRKDSVLERVDILKKAGFFPLLLSMESKSLSTIWRSILNKGEGSITALMIYLNEDSFTICAFPNINSQTDSLDTSGDFHDSSFYKVFNFDDSLINSAQEKAEPFYRFILNKIESQLPLYSSIFPKSSITDLLFAGNQGVFKTLLPRFEKDLSIPCQWLNISTLFFEAGSNVTSLAGYERAAGLAMQGIAWLRTNSHAR